MIIRLILTLLPWVTMADPLINDKDFICSNADSSCSTKIGCMNCVWPQCELGEDVSIVCTSREGCRDQVSRPTPTKCLFCWQLPPENYHCRVPDNCTTASPEWHSVLCKVHLNVQCKGNRMFFKNVRCNWSSGYSWSRALFLSITLGGFGVDRFYLGLWKSAIGKLFSFGGLGIWTVVDVVLVALGYIRPSDGSLYL